MRLKREGGPPNRRSSAGRWLPGLVLASGIAAAGRRAGALSDGGAAAAVFVGGTIFGRGGKRLALPLIGFFISSSLLSRIRTTERPEIEAITVKGGKRDHFQVLANGGVPATLALVSSSLLPESMVNAAYTGALAAVTADTWSTEFGGLSPAPPRSILNGKVVPAGLSGGVTLVGLAGAALGGAMIGFVSWSAGGKHRKNDVVRVVASATVTGIAGSLIDSLLGASLQQIYYCPDCDILTEQQVHRCGTISEPRRGLAWMTNDTVNFLTSLSGSLIGAALIPSTAEE